jgi:hypothetical protein
MREKKRQGFVLAIPFLIIFAGLLMMLVIGLLVLG